MDQKTVLPSDVLLVSFDFTHGDDHQICIVGRKTGGMLEVVNAFEGDNARAIFDLLTTMNKVNKRSDERRTTVG